MSSHMRRLRCMPCGARAAIAAAARSETRRESVAKFAEPEGDDSIKAALLSTIMSNYENLALGVRHHIIDETYLHRSICGLLIFDWHYFSRS